MYWRLRGVGHLLEISLRLLVKFVMWNMKFEILLGYFRLLFPCTCCIFMHLSILCPTTPHPGYIGGKVGHLTCFDTKTCPICGEFDRLPYACATIKSTDDQIPHLFLDY